MDAQQEITELLIQQTRLTLVLADIARSDTTLIIGVSRRVIQGAPEHAIHNMPIEQPLLFSALRAELARVEERLVDLQSAELPKTWGNAA